MRNKLSFLILSNTGSPTKQFTISKVLLKFFSFITVLSLAASGYVVYRLVQDYISLKNVAHNNRILSARIVEQNSDIEAQRKQIQSFARKINLLKNKLLALNKFEKEIRIIANIEKPDDDSELFGVGGATPENLDPKIPLKQKHTRLIREMHEQAELVDLALINQKEGFEDLFDSLGEKLSILACTPSIHPVRGRVTSKFGYRKSPFTGRRHFHRGFDIANRPGTPIVATADGKVIFAGKNGLMGNVITIDHGHGLRTRYGHLKSLKKKRGDTVKRGDVIGLMGMSGRTTGPHVHYEVHLNNVPVNPVKYMLD
jgi:murein DD-endopeptidase MepM/ murein hydrolase activator NlpD